MVAVSTAVYIDGFNFYYGAARPHGIRWVDLRRLSQRILGRRHFVEQVYLYTALLHLRDGDGAPVRNHEIFLRAQRVAAGAKIVLGTHVSSVRRLPLSGPDGAPGPLVRVIQTTEKGTDVNLAVDLVHHALTGRHPCAVVISHDSDLARALHVARVDGAVPVGLINPQPGKRSQQLAAEASFTKEIRRADLFASLLPDRIANEGGEILRPSDW